MEIKDYSNCKKEIFVYGGKTSNKKSIYDENNVWILKFPQNIKSKETIAMSYTTSPVSEYIGSHIYQSMGFPVHETKLEAAIKRNYPKIDLDKINTIIDDIPEYANGLLIISNDRKTLYKRILADRSTIFEQLYNLICTDKKRRT